MIKNDFLTFLRHAVNAEERGIDLCMKHMENTLFLSDFNKGEQESIKSVLQRIHGDSLKHKALYQSVIDYVQRNESNVF